MVTGSSCMAVCGASAIVADWPDRKRLSARAANKSPASRRVVGRSTTAPPERMKMEHLLAQLDGIWQHTAKGDLDYKGASPRRAADFWLSTKTSPGTARSPATSPGLAHNG